MGRPPGPPRFLFFLRKRGGLLALALAGGRRCCCRRRCCCWRLVVKVVLAPARPRRRLTNGSAPVPAALLKFSPIRALPGLRGLLRGLAEEYCCCRLLRWVTGQVRRVLWVLQEVGGRGHPARMPKSFIKEVAGNSAAPMQLVRVHGAVPTPKPMNMSTSIKVRWAAVEVRRGEIGAPGGFSQIAGTRRWGVVAAAAGGWLGGWVLLRRRRWFKFGFSNSSWAWARR